MAVRYKFTPEHAAFLQKNAQFQDMVVGHMAQDIEVVIKTGGKTPTDKGQMKADVRHFKIGRGIFRVVSPKEYSAVQEAGQRRGSAPFTHYTTPGTGKSWFITAIRQVLRNGKSYVKEAQRSAGL